MEQERPLILLSNDDGVDAEGLLMLERAMTSLGDVVVVAPDRERSAASHSLTLYRPLRVKEVRPNVFSVDGTPTDCINLAVNGILAGRKPNLVVAGINRGGNMGDDILYSGTVSAAMEAALLKIPAFAVSLDSRNNPDYTAAANFTRKLAVYLLANGLPPDTILNVNVPNLPEDRIRGYQFSRMGKRIYGDAIVEKTDPRGNKYFWIGGQEMGFEPVGNSDIEAVQQDMISITPIQVDMTNYSLLKTLTDINI